MYFATNPATGKFSSLGNPVNPLNVKRQLNWTHTLTTPVFKLRQ